MVTRKTFFLIIMKGIILAAGSGTRLGAVGKKTPKCLLEVDGEKLLERHVRVSRYVGCNQISIVIGQEGEPWTKNNIQKVASFDIRIVQNKYDKRYKRPYSLLRGLESIEEPESDTLIIDGDIIYNQKLLSYFVDEASGSSILTRPVSSKGLKRKGSKVVIDEKNKVLKMGHDEQSRLLYSGVFLLTNEDFIGFKSYLGDDSHWNENFSEVINGWVVDNTIYNVSFNTDVSLVEPRSFSGDPTWEPANTTFKDKGSKLRKSTGPNGKEKLIDEVEWILSLPSGASEHFPKVFSYEEGEGYASYLMKRYDYPDFMELLFEKKISVSKSKDLLEKIFEFMFDEIYSQEVKEPSPGFINSYLQKFAKRKETITGKNKTLSELMNSEELIINGAKLRNVPKILEIIRDNIKFNSTLEPPFLSLYHGDFKFDNFLVDKENNDFILIDPRGKAASGEVVSDPLEDIAKLLTSSHGYYDFFYRDYFSLDSFNKNGETFEINYSLELSNVRNYLSNLTEYVLKLLPKFNSIKEDPYWERRLFFVEAILLAANAPFHYKGRDDLKLVIGLYSRAVELFNDFIREYPLENDTKYRLININTIEDYKKAESLFQDS